MGFCNLTNCLRDSFVDSLCIISCTFRKRTNFFCNNGKTFTKFAGVSRFNCSIHRKQVCLFCNRVNQSNNFANFIKLTHYFLKNFIRCRNLTVTIRNKNTHLFSNTSTFNSIFPNSNYCASHSRNGICTFVNCNSLTLIVCNKSSNLFICKINSANSAFH